METTGDTAQPLLTEIPSSLKQLARLVVRGFYSLEDALIVDMLVRYPCLREDDICNLLKFDKKMLRAKIAGLRNDKFLQAKPRIETNEDNKVVKMNCYFINYKIFVNIVKYKLDLMQKKMETSERDATNRSSFKCSGCDKHFTDLEADQLLDLYTGELKCTFCSAPVDEDEAAGPQQDSRLLLAKFNTQMEKLYDLLHAVENIRMAPYLLDPEPVELTGPRGAEGDQRNRGNGPADGQGKWSGEATRTHGLRTEDQQINIEFGNESAISTEARREVPVWITESTVTSSNNEDTRWSDSGSRMEAAVDVADVPDPVGPDNEDEITSLLLRHEKRSGPQNSLVQGTGNDSDSDKSDSSDIDDIAADAFGNSIPKSSIEKPVDKAIEQSDEESGDIPSVVVGNEEIAITDVTPEIIARMTPEEQERYTQTFQDFYSDMYD